MNLSTYDIVNMLINLLNIYAIYKLVRVFLMDLKVRKEIEILSYTAYGIAMIGICFWVKIPNVILLLSIGIIFVITHLYRASLKKRLIAIMHIYMILIVIEIAVAFVSSYLLKSIYARNEYSAIVRNMSITILMYIVALCLEKGKEIRNGVEVPWTYWASIIGIPATSLFLLRLLLNKKGISRGEVVSGTFLIVLIDFLAFYLYDSLSLLQQKNLEMRLREEQNKNYKMQFELMEHSFEKIRGMRHDMRNHLLTIRTLADSEDNGELLAYLDQMVSVISNTGKQIETGNPAIDRILNNKIEEAKSYQISVRTKVTVPADIQINVFEMTIILGNLIDNAINELQKIPIQDRELIIGMRYDRSRLIIQIDNRYQKPDMAGQKCILMSKSANHGIGLVNVKKVVNRNRGTMEQVIDGLWFKTFIMLYLSE